MPRPASSLYLALQEVGCSLAQFEQIMAALVETGRLRKEGDVYFDACFSPHLYRARNLVERFFNKIKQCRRIATRYDKLAANYLAFIKLASIRLWLRTYESTP